MFNMSSLKDTPGKDTDGKEFISNLPWYVCVYVVPGAVRSTLEIPVKQLLQ